MRTLLGLAILFGDPLTFDTTPLGEKDRPCRPGPMASDWNPYDNIPTTTKKGVDYLEAQAKTEEPFFLYFAYPSPHAPIIPNDEFDGKSKAGLYGDLVYETDHSIGQLLKALKDSGQAENPIVIFSADNGPEHYACARDAKFDHWSAHPFR
ncbi:MAG: sulfatase-like hydrolase/transferase, partial [Akkermansiaceae bacterium]|nr:sulfatase-like hydrolase/transferase [Akkermansiaceae bacterium]